jgi:hypothetical protein
MKALMLAGLIGIGLYGRAEAANIWPEQRRGGLGGTYVHIDGEIVQGDEEHFAAVALGAPRPVYVIPTGPGGSVGPALAISDMIAQSGFSTMAKNGVSCASSCAWIWASGYSHHAIAESNAIIRFHSCYDTTNGRDDEECNDEVVRHLMQYGLTQRQASFAVLAPHETTFVGTRNVAAALGLNWQWLNSGLGSADTCQARLCIYAPNRTATPRPQYRYPNQAEQAATAFRMFGNMVCAMSGRC